MNRVPADGQVVAVLPGFRAENVRVEQAQVGPLVEFALLRQPLVDFPFEHHAEATQAVDVIAICLCSLPAVPRRKLGPLPRQQGSRSGILAGLELLRGRCGRWTVSTSCGSAA